MDFYDFLIPEFTIRNTRAAETDTLVLNATVYVNGGLVAATDVLSLGDHGKGTYHVQDFLHDQMPGVTGVVINDPDATVTFVFQLLNAGNSSASNLSARVIATADALSGIIAGTNKENIIGDLLIAALGASGPFWVALGIEAFADVYSWLTTSCDGPVAADTLTAPRYALDAISDDTYPDSVVFTKNYPGTDSADFCGGNSAYEATWEFQHYRGWAAVADPTGTPLQSLTGMSATEHNNALHVFGLDPVTGVTHARTFTGAMWRVDTIPLGALHPVATLPVSAASFDDRLSVFLVAADGSISSLAYTEDGGHWTPRATSPTGLHTTTAPATAVFGNRLFILAIDQATKNLRVTSSADLIAWNPWTNLPNPGQTLMSAPTAATLNDTLHVFAVVRTGKHPATAVMRTATTDGITWTGWDTVEGGIPPEKHPDDAVLDVAATTFRDRVYLASRWQNAGDATQYIAINFSGDGTNWSGWRPPPATLDMAPSQTPGLAAAGNHLYVVAPKLSTSGGDSTDVWVH